MPAEEDIFITIHIQGAILPADLLRRIVTGDASLGGLSPQDYHLAEGERLNDAVNRSWNRLSGLWSHFRVASQSLPDSDLGTTLTRERWLLPLFQELGYGRLQTARAIEIKGKPFPISHSWGNTPVHLVGSRLDLDVKKAGVAGAARSSPHSLIQELLNTSEAHLWAFVSNGLILRILRDNASLVRQAYVEFDLAAMFDNQAYADFVLLWLICHQSRVESERPEECWLERWSKDAQLHGARALEKLREGVEKAISVLGSGFLKHPANQALKDRLRVAALSTQDYYRQILRMVYRLLFLFVAEDRDSLLAPGASEESRSRYIKYYSTSRLRRLADHLRGTRHTDLYQVFRFVTTRLGSDTGCPELGLPALNGFLFSKEAIPDLESCELSNMDLLDAVRALAFLSNESGRRPVDYKNLRSEELGSVYEALLELHPRLNTDAGTFELTTAAGHERKATGSYYTPESLVLCLLDSALDPVLEEACRKPNPEEAILQLKVCDPACGSGHFPIAAAHRIAKRLASIRTGDEEPAPSAMQKALRDVISHCIYGVDQNPMAVELCKVALWMESLEPGKPLSFLDHHIQCGNSLLGTTPALLKKGVPDEAFTAIEGDDKELCKTYKKQNKEERKGIQSLPFEQPEPWMQLGNLATAMMTLDTIADDTVGGVRDKQQRYEEFVKSSAYLYGRLIADAWCAAFVWKKSQDPALPYPITEGIFRKIEHNPHSTPGWMKAEIQRLAERYKFFHWHLAFPDVFRMPRADEAQENKAAGGDGGFDAMVGNPPWERVKFQEREWFSAPRPDIANADTAAIRERLIGELAVEDPRLYREYQEAQRQAEAEAGFAIRSGRFRYGAGGDTNTYPLFIETAMNTISQKGRVGIIVKSGILADFSLKEFFGHLVDSGRFVSAFDFSNKKLIFPAVVANERFTLLTLCGPGGNNKGIKISILNEDVSDLLRADRTWELSQDDISAINPNTKTCPLFQTARDAVLVSSIYRRHSVLTREDATPQGREWGATYFTMFHMTNDSGFFRDQETLQRESDIGPRSKWVTQRGEYVALLEGKLYDLFDHRHGTFEGVPRSSRFGIKAEANHPSIEQRLSPSFECLPRYWVPAEEVRRRYIQRLQFTPTGVLTFRDVCRTHTDLRTVRAAICPPFGAGNKAPLLLFPGINRQEHAVRSALLCANLAALALDYIARQKFAGGSLNKFILLQFPVVSPASLEIASAWSAGSQALRDWVLPRVLELTYTSWELEAFAQDCGWAGPPFRWDEERRFLVRSELDAAYFHLYLPTETSDGWHGPEGEKEGDLARLKAIFPTPRDAVAYVIDTFPILKRKDEERFGEYRTKRVILEIYDAMAEASRTGQSYQTRLDPPPGPPINDLPDWLPGAPRPANWPSHIHSPHRN